MFCRIITLLLVLSLPAVSQVIIKAVQADGVIDAIGETTIAYPGPRISPGSRPSGFLIMTEVVGAASGCEYQIQGTSADVDASGFLRGTSARPAESTWSLIAPESGVLSCQPGQDDRSHQVANRSFPAIRVRLSAGTGLTNLIVRYQHTD